MPRHKIIAAIKELDVLKASAREGIVLTNGEPIIDAALDGDINALIQQIGGQMKEFQLDHVSEVLEGSKAGEKLGRGLLEHIERDDNG